MSKRRYPIEVPYTWWIKDGCYEGCFDAYPQYRMRENSREALEDVLKGIYECIAVGVLRRQTQKASLKINRPKPVTTDPYGPLR